MFQIDLCANGLVTKGLQRDCPPLPSFIQAHGRKRRSISGFSSASCRRLRNALCRWVGEGSPYAFTFTFPYDLSGSEYRLLFERFRHRLAYAGHCMVWRVELTRHRRPHLHCVVYLREFELAFDVQCMWWDVVNAYAFEGGCFYSCVFQHLTGARWWRYVAAHTAKQKVVQLGWRGRQWGFVNKSAMWDTSRFVVPTVVGFHRVLRVLRRLSRSRFSSRGHYGDCVWFCSADTASRLASWAAID